MAFLNEKTFDMVLEDGTDFGYKLTLTEVSEVCSEHPVTKEPINCVPVRTPIDIANLTFSGNISLSLDEGSTSAASFTFTKINVLGGVVQMTLSKALIDTLIPQASSTRDKYNTRVRFLGYYDVVVLDTSTTSSTRILQGKVYVSDGVTD